MSGLSFEPLKSARKMISEDPGVFEYFDSRATQREMNVQ